MIHTLYRRATHTFHTPSWVTSYLLLVFLSSSSLQFVFSEQLGFERQLRSQLLWFKLVSRSIKHQQTENNELQARSNQAQPINHASTKQENNKGSRSLRQQGHLFASASVILGTLKPQTVSSGYLTGQANKRFLQTKAVVFKVPKVHKLQTSSENEV